MDVTQTPKRRQRQRRHTPRANDHLSSRGTTAIHSTISQLSAIELTSVGSIGDSPSASEETTTTARHPETTAAFEQLPCSNATQKHTKQTRTKRPGRTRNQTTNKNTFDMGLESTSGGGVRARGRGASLCLGQSKRILG